LAFLWVGCLSALVGVFAASAAGKLRGGAPWSGFVESIRDLRLVRERAVLSVAVGAVAAETCVVVLLLVPFLRPAGLVLAGGLLASFTVAIVATLRRRIAVVCRCFGLTSALPLGWRHVVRNGLLLVLVALGGVSRLRASGAPEAAGLAVAAAAGVVAAVVLVFFDEFVELFTSPSQGARG
jgi:hypothetical protein